MRPIPIVSLRILAALYVACLALVSLLPSGIGPLRGWDASLPSSVQTALHLPAYAVLALLVIIVLPSGWASQRTVGIVIAIGCIAFGTALECAQANIIGRTGSLADILLNAVGVLVGYLTAWVWLKMRLKKTAKAQDALDIGEPTELGAR